MNFNRSFLVAMVAVGALTLSACGKKKEEPKDLGAPAPAAPAPAPTDPAHTPQPPVQQQGPVPSGQQPGQPSRPGQQGPIKPPQPGKRDPRVDQGSPGRGGQVGQSGEQSRARQTKKGDVQDAEQIETAKHMTGAQNKDGLIFTGSAPDETLETLRKYEAELSAGQQESNKNLAQSIEGIEYAQDVETQEVIVAIRLKEGQHSEIYNLVSRGVVDNTIVKANKVNSALGLRTSGRNDVSGTVQCLDLDVSENLCRNVLISFTLKKGHSSSTAKILVRSTYADGHADLQDASGNPEFAVLKDFMVNSHMDRDTKNKIDSIHMLTYEVVNGRAGYDLQIMGLNKEYIGFRGDLVASAAGSGVNVSVEKTSPRLNSGIVGNDELRLNLLNTIGPVRLIMNDGNGKLKLKMAARPFRNFPKDEFTLTFTRRAKAVLSVGPASLN